jgi:ABC-type glycerol-3-phosphate transport system substrate-binding protein
MVKEEKKINRRDYLKYTGAAIGGLVVGGALGYLLKPSEVMEKTVTVTSTIEKIATPPTTVVTLPTTIVTTIPVTPTITPAKKPIVVLWWTSELDEAWRQQFNEFEKKTGLEVVFEPVGWSDMHTKQLTAFAAKSGRFDVSFSYPPWFPSDWIHFEPLNQYISKEDINKIMEEAIKACTFDEKLIVLPFFSTLRVLHYRKDLFEKAGITRPPKNWDEMIEYGKEVQKMTNGEVWGTLWAWKGDMGIRFFSILLNAVGGKLYDENLKPAFNSPEGLRVMEFINDIMNTHKICPPAATTWTSTGTMMPVYYGGKAAMVIEDVSLAITVDKTIPVPSSSSIALVPGTEVNHSASIILPQGFFINKYSTNKDAALELIKYFSLNTDAVVKMYELTGYFPVLKSALTDPRLIEKPINKLMFETALEQTKYPCENWCKHPKYSIFKDVIDEEIVAMVLGQKTPKQALNDAEERIKKQL